MKNNLLILYRNKSKKIRQKNDMTKEGGKCFKEHTRIRRIVNFVMIVFLFSNGDISREVIDKNIRSVGFCDLRHTLSAALSLE